MSVLTAGYLAGLAVALAALALGSGHTGWGAFLREIVHLLFVPVPVLLVLAGLVRAQRTFLALLVPLAVFAAGCGPLLAIRTPSAPTGPSFRVMTFNVGAARGLESPERVIETVRAARPDVAALVEARRDTLATLGPALRATYPYQASSAQTAIISRFPLLDDRDNPHLAGAHDVLTVTIVVGDRPVSLTAVHLRRIDGYTGLGSGPLPLLRAIRTFSTAERDAAVDALMSQADSVDYARVIVGDFNMTPTSRAYGLMTGAMRDSFREAGWGLGHSYPTTLRSLRSGLSVPLLRIDYVFHSDALVATSARVGPGGGSDHLPVVSDLAFR
ncbi:MAG: endonuclease/exonuclease/phosphatase family protein [Chloroflexi bacterium]|nr:endonuclease/exonuclease/phosphatase family protein [Chloroflexota bacterium]